MERSRRKIVGAWYKRRKRRIVSAIDGRREKELICVLHPVPTCHCYGRDQNTIMQEDLRQYRTIYLKSKAGDLSKVTRFAFEVERYSHPELSFIVAQNRQQFYSHDNPQKDTSYQHQIRGTWPLKIRVLIIHSNRSLCAEIEAALCDTIMIIDTAYSPSEAINLFLRYDYSLILLDTGPHGKEIIKPLRAITSVPILALCGLNDPKDRCSLLEAGASVCLTKPIDSQECAAQINALLNLYFATGEKRAIQTVAYGTEFVIDPDFRITFIKGNLIKLSRREFDLLFFLASHDKRVFSKQQLYEQVWGYEPRFSVDETVKSCIKHLRQKLGPPGKDYVQSVRGIGYRFVSERTPLL